MEELKYPLGKADLKEKYSAEDINYYIETLEALPYELEKLIEGITEDQLNTPYRDGGWTARQVIHHMSDSHLNMLIRLKWTLTEDTPTIKAYDENLWAQLPDYQLPIEVSVNLLKSIHTKIVALAKSFSEEDLKKSYYHPESKSEVNLGSVLALYTWHSKHHLAHIKICKGEWSF